MIPAAQLIESARSWVGVPFRHQGRSQVGVDCIGFVVVLLRQADSLPRNFHEPNNYARTASPELARIVSEHCTRVFKPEPGALVLIRWPKVAIPSHAGLCTGSTLIHCYQTVGGVVEHGYREPWLRLTHSLWRMPGVLYE